MRDVAQRLRRLLFIVPYVAKHPEGVAVDQLAKLIGAERDELLDGHTLGVLRDVRHDEQ